jgi:hypothetical protein
VSPLYNLLGPDPFISQSSPDHSPQSIFHIKKSRDQTSVLLSVLGIPADVRFRFTTFLDLKSLVFALHNIQEKDQHDFDCLFSLSNVFTYTKLRTPKQTDLPNYIQKPTAIKLGHLNS